MKNNNLSVDSFKKIVGSGAKSLMRYETIIFFMIVAAIYGFILFRINMLSNIDPDQSVIDKATTATKQPHVDPATVSKIQSLQDNSVSVQSLFDSARQNPFQE